MRVTAAYACMGFACLWCTDWVVVRGIRQISKGSHGIHNDVFSGRVNAEYLVSGSSRALVQYDTPLLEELSGASWFNIGLDGEETDLHFAYLSAYFSKNKAPAVVIQNIDPWALGPFLRTYDNERYVPYLDCDALYNPLCDIDAQVWKHRHIPMYKFAGRPRLIIKGILGNIGVADRFVDENRILGFKPIDRQPLDPESTIAWIEENADDLSVSIQSDGVGKKYVARIMDLCSRYRSRLVLVVAPLWDERVKRTSNLQRFEKQMQRFAEANHVTYISLLDHPVSTDHENFYNSSHLRKSGAEKFSRALFEQLEKLGLVDSADQQ